VTSRSTLRSSLTKSPTPNALLDVKAGKNAVYPLLGFGQANIKRFHKRRDSKLFLVRTLA